MSRLHKILSIAILAILVASFVPTISLGLPKAAAANLVVTPTYLNYNILMVKVYSKSPPVVGVMDSAGNVKYYLLLAKTGDNEWTGFVALRKAIDVSFAYSAKATKVDVSGASIDLTGKIPDIYLATKGLEMVEKSRLVVVEQTIAIGGTTNVSITAGGKLYVSGENASKAWPFINVIDLSKSMTIFFGDEQVKVKISESAISFVKEDRTKVPPEGIYRLTIKDVTLATDPTAADSSYNDLSFSNSTVFNATTSPKFAKELEIFNLSKSGLVGAIRAALKEVGVDDVSVNVSIDNSSADKVYLVLKTNYVGKPSELTLVAKVEVTFFLSATPNEYNKTTVKFYTVLPTTSGSKRVKVLDTSWPGLAGYDFSKDIVNATVKVTLYFIPYSYSLSIGGTSKDVSYMMPLSIYATGSDLGEYTIKFKLFGKVGSSVLYSTPDTVLYYFKVVNATENAAGGKKLYICITEFRSEDLAPGALLQPKLVDYVSGEPTKIARTLFVEMETATISVTTASVKIGGTLVVEVTDADANKDAAAKDSVYITMTLAGKTYTIKARETDVNSGVFKASISVGLSSKGYTYYDYDSGVIYVYPRDLASGKISIAFTYHDKYTAVISPTDVAYTAEIVRAPVSLEAPASILPGSILEIKLVNPNINVDSSSYDLIELSCGTGYCNVYWKTTKTKVYVGRLEVSKINIHGQSVAVTPQLINYVITESAVDSGTFVIKMLTKGFNVGEKIKIVYKDEFYNGEVVAVKEVAVGGVMAEIKVAEKRGGVIPIAVYFNGTKAVVNVKVVVKDPDRNTNPGGIDYADVYVVLINGSGKPVTTVNGNKYLVLRLLETGPNTSVFEGVVQVEYSYTITSSGVSGTVRICSGGDCVSESIEAMIGGLLRVEYEEPLSAEVSPYTHKNVVYATAVFQPATAELSVSKSVVSLTDEIVITLKEPDLDLDVAKNDTLPNDLKLDIYIDGTKVGTFSLVALGAKFVEVEPGVFEWKVKVANLISSVTSGTPNDYVGSTVKIVYTDPVSAMSVFNKLVPYKVSASFKIASHTAKVIVTPEKAGPYSVIIINISDPDLIGLTASDILNKGWIRVSSSVESPKNISNVVKVETYDASKGIYVFKLRLNLVPKTGPIPKNDELEVAAHDTVAIVYKDLVDETGNARAIVKYVTIATETGKIEVPATVAPDSKLTIVVKDLDADRNPTMRDTLTVYVWSSASPVRTQVTLVETGPATHVFKQEIIVTSDASKIGETNTVYAPEGSTIYIAYVDPLNKDAEKETVKAEVKVVAAPTVPYPIKPKAEEAKLIYNGKEVSKIPPGAIAYIALPVNNTDTKSVSFYAIVVVEKDGVPVGVALGTYTVAGKTSQVIYVPLPIIREPGTYTVKILLWNNIVEQRPLSEEVVKLTLEVSS